MPRPAIKGRVYNVGVELNDDSVEIDAIIERLNGDKVTIIDLHDNDIADRSVHRIVQALMQTTQPYLQSFLLGTNSITEQGAQWLGQYIEASSCPLLHLSLSSNSIGDEGATYLATAMKKNTDTCLQSLAIDDNDIGTEGAVALALMIKSNMSLHSLVMEGNDIGDEGAEALADALESNIALLSLNVCSCDIGNDGAVAIANALKHNTQLLRLNFSHNFAESVGADAFALALCKNTALQQLQLTGNNIRDIPNMGVMLATNKTLRRLSLQGNKIVHVHDIVAGLCTSTSLYGLDLSDNRLGSAELAVLLDALMKCDNNSSLEFIDFRNCAFGAVDGSKLEELQRLRPRLSLLFDDDGANKDSYCQWTRHSVILRSTDAACFAEHLAGSMSSPPSAT